MEFADLLRTARAAQGLSQERLARLANVSTRTISAAEHGTSPSRPDVVQRLARALKRDVNEWIVAAGLTPVGEAGAATPVRRSGYLETDAIRFFADLAERVGDRPTLMLVLYSAVPLALVSPEVLEDLARALRNNMWLALHVPYVEVREDTHDHPSVSNSFSLSKPPQTWLARFNQDVLTTVRGLAAELIARLEPERHDRVRLFLPKADGPELLISPPGYPVEVRPFLLYHLNGEGAIIRGASTFCCLFRLPTENRNRVIWRETPEISERDPVRIWENYFRDSIDAWNNGWASFESLTWRTDT